MCACTWLYPLSRSSSADRTRAVMVSFLVDSGAVKRLFCAEDRMRQLSVSTAHFVENLHQKVNSKARRRRLQEEKELVVMRKKNAEEEEKSEERVEKERWKGFEEVE